MKGVSSPPKICEIILNFTGIFCKNLQNQYGLCQGLHCPNLATNSQAGIEQICQARPPTIPRHSLSGAGIFIYILTLKLGRLKAGVHRSAHIPQTLRGTARTDCRPRKTLGLRCRCLLEVKRCPTTCWKVLVYGSPISRVWGPVRSHMDTRPIRSTLHAQRCGRGPTHRA